MTTHRLRPILSAARRPSQHSFGAVTAGVCASVLLTGAAGTTTLAFAAEPVVGSAAQAQAPVNAPPAGRPNPVSTVSSQPDNQSLESLRARDRLLVEQAEGPSRSLTEEESRSREETLRELAEWRLKRVQLEARQAQRRSVPREVWPEMMNSSKLQYLRGRLFTKEQRLASTLLMLSEGKKAVAAGRIPNDGSDTDAAWAPSLRVYRKDRDIALLDLNYEMDLIAAKMDLELLRAIEQELILADKVRDMAPAKASLGPRLGSR